MVPQLLNPIDESELEKYISDDRWWMQEKLDGKRLLICKDRQQVTGINRRGLAIALPGPIAQAVADMDADRCLLDGECIGDVYHAFDLLERSGQDLRSSPYAVRYGELMNVADAVGPDAVRCAAVATDAGAKRLMLDVLRRDKREGVVLKDQTAPCTPGRPGSGGTQLKCKFYATASCIVLDINAGRRSVLLAVTDGKRRVAVGSVTIPPDHAIPARGGIVEVRYLYAYPGGSLYQPVYLGVRDDVSPAGCALGQLKYKAQAEDEGGLTHPPAANPNH